MYISLKELVESFESILLDVNVLWKNAMVFVYKS